MDDRRVGLIVRALRRRRGWRQVDLATATRRSQASISMLERGHLDGFSFQAVRRVLAALEARGELDIRWRGGSIDRTMDEGHARLVGAVVATLRALGWEIAVEVTYAVYGERGSIDVLAFHPETSSLLVVEVKTELTSVEETLRRLDQKVRLAGQVALDRWGWRGPATSCVLVLPETSTTRGQLLRHAGVFDSALPDGNLIVTRWLKRPSGTIRARWFLRIINPRSPTGPTGGGQRVRRAGLSTQDRELSTNPSQAQAALGRIRAEHSRAVS